MLFRSELEGWLTWDLKRRCMENKILTDPYVPGVAFEIGTPIGTFGDVRHNLRYDFKLNIQTIVNKRILTGLPRRWSADLRLLHKFKKTTYPG